MQRSNEVLGRGGGEDIEEGATFCPELDPNSPSDSVSLWLVNNLILFFLKLARTKIELALVAGASSDKGLDAEAQSRTGLDICRPMSPGKILT